jgi:hypothetical protein
MPSSRVLALSFECRDRALPFHDQGIGSALSMSSSSSALKDALISSD